MLRSNYLYATGRVRVLENKLVTQEDLDRMIGAKNAQAAFRVFNDLDFTEELADVYDENAFNEILDHDLSKTKKLIKQIVPDKELIEITHLSHDFHNLKLFFLSKFHEVDLSDQESQLGNYDVAKLRDMVKNETRGDYTIPPAINDVVTEAQKVFRSNYNPHKIDIYLDKKYYELILDIGKKMGNKFILEHIVHRIDLANVKTFIRAKNLKKPLEFIKNDLIEGGKINPRELINAYDQNIENAFPILTSGFRDPKIQQAIKEFYNIDNFWKLEKAVEEHEMRFFRQTKYMSYGPEVVIAYSLVKRDSARNLRLIMSAKIAGLPSEEIRERIREIYF